MFPLLLLTLQVRMASRFSLTSSPRLRHDIGPSPPPPPRKHAPICKRSIESSLSSRMLVPAARLLDDRGCPHRRTTGCRPSPVTDHKRRARPPCICFPAGVVPRRPSAHQAGFHRFHSSSKISTPGTDQYIPAKLGDKVQNEQSAQLWSERLAIQQKHQEKTKVAATKLVSFLHHLRCSHPSDGPQSQYYRVRGGIPVRSGCRPLPCSHVQFSASFPTMPLPQALTQAYKKDLHMFDTQRVIVAWDGSIPKQQAVLELLGVPKHVCHRLGALREMLVLTDQYKFSAAIGSF